ncbi:uncharacterized protein GGS22DRAFT_192084 [Annulohypoxylon maeteangense]|uniref:uncharacterized protein n=1 Tax=Annulohypoxylon maeteangense TaxID=1927788 RepID=UPI0020079C77|nr:uncharacterized protein GGS22DRAFT_192084 [Annulohypoxylon maeteangense]KAI0881451.1 hypothetical protein GGS22DRAFT_192084 [Annulohypoxylon maeteangense]
MASVSNENCSREPWPKIQFSWYLQSDQEGSNAGNLQGLNYIILAWAPEHWQYRLLLTIPVLGGPTLYFALAPFGTLY